MAKKNILVINMGKKKEQELLDLVKRNYQEIATDFDTTRKKEIWPEIRKFTAEIEENSQVLDLGCGNGRLLEALKEKKIKYLGLDNSTELIRLAKINYPENSFLVGDILDLGSLQNNYYDYIFCLATLQHIPGKNLRLKALREMESKLKTGGKLILSNWNLWSQKKYRSQLLKNYWLKIFGRSQLGYNDLIFPWKSANGKIVSERYYHAFTKKEFKKLIKLTNFKTQESWRDKHNFWLLLVKK